MNQSDVKTQLTVHGYIAEFRLAWRADFQPVLRMDDDGRRLGVEYFKNEKDAELAAWRTMNRIEQSAMVRDGEKLQTKSAAEALFRPRDERKAVRA